MWTERIDTRRGDMAHGITFIMQERKTPRTRGEAALGARKAQIDARVSVTLALNQRKFGDELIAQAYSRDGWTASDRRDSSHGRIQVYLGPADEDTAAMLERVAAHIRKRLRGGERFGLKNGNWVGDEK